MLPRLFVEGELYINSEISLSENKFHYLINVLKCKEEENIILINGIDGEFSAKITKITNKRCEVKVSEKIKDYYRQNFLALAFSPIDKIDILVKSATELGVTDFYPIKTKYTKHMKINKILPNMIEAVEQCERLDLPIIHKMQTLESFLNNFNEEESLLIFCEERSNNNIIKDIQIEN
ncbi:MAG: 16S rRNA (uracil(1498)-N(3))-methyltransferase, partial [Rickettsiales bacterium]|nr:16S rRNA (uracil(1498)-N(3))-methyltransferase [Rickettsiales bacterium]